MNYIAQLYFKIEIESEKKAQYDCQIRMIQADNEEEAFFIAKALGLQEEMQFPNEKGQLVKWSFAGITEIRELNLVENGSQLFSSTIETEIKDTFLQYIQTKTKDLALNLSKKELIFSL